MPGRRYSGGQGEGCDIAVDGVYASRRHCELWFDKGTWWAADAGSTNGIRAESMKGVLARSQQGIARDSVRCRDRARAWHAAGALRAYPGRAAAIPAVVAESDRSGPTRGTKVSTAADGGVVRRRR